MCRELAYDVTEMAATTYLVARDHGKPFTALAGFRALEERGLWPVNHLVVVKDEVLEANPDLARALFDAFEQAKDLYVAGELQPLHARVAEITGGDPLRYGVEPNRAVLEQLVDHAFA